MYKESYRKLISNTSSERFMDTKIVIFQISLIFFPVASNYHYPLLLKFVSLPFNTFYQSEKSLKRLVFFASGSGTNFQSVIDAVEAGDINATIRGLIVNKKGIGAAERAEKHNISVEVLSSADFETETEYEKKLLEILEKWDAYLIVLAGYLLKIPRSVIKNYSGQIINIHPSLLPKYGGKGFYGEKVHQAVLKGSETESGCSVHVVTEAYDEGPILAQREVPVYQDDTQEKLAARVLKKEHELLPEVLRNLVEERNYYCE